MAENSKIEWTDHTFNPWIGCTKVGPGCDHCYAENMMDHRYGRVRWGAGQPRQRTSEANWRKPEVWNRAANGSRPRVFCASLADVFDNEAPDAWRSDLWRLIQRTPNLDWLLLTKRIGNAHRMLPAFMKPWPNLWIGATVVNQEEADRDIPKLLDLPATVRFLSCEPLVGPLDLWNGDPDPRLGGHRATHTFLGEWWEPGEDGPPRHGVDWVIVGGESGAGARPMHPDWVRSLRDQCQAAEVPFLFKQWGEWRPPAAGERYNTINGQAGSPPAFLIDPTGNVHCTHDAAGEGATPVIRVGKARAGRMLDGRTWDQFPQP